MKLTRTRVFSRLTASALVLGSCLLTASAVGQSSAVAESLFQEGKRLMGEGKIEEACAKFEASQRAAPAGGTLLNLASCNEKLGRVATAWGQFQEARQIAKRDGREERVQYAQSQVDALEPRLPKLVIAVPSEAAVPGLRITRNGQPLDDGAWGAPIPIDPGEVKVRAEADGYEPFEKRVKIGEGQLGRITIPALKKLPDAPKPPPGSAGTAGGSGAAAEPGPDPTPYYVWGGITAGLGAVVAGVGVPFYLRREDKAKEWNGSACEQPTGQTREQQCSDVKSDIDSAQTLSTVFFGAGGALLVTGVVLFAIAPSGSSAATPEDQAKKSPVLCGGGPGDVGVSCFGRF